MKLIALLPISFVFGCLLYCNTLTAQPMHSMLPDVDTGMVRKLIDTARKYYPKVYAFKTKVAFAQTQVKRERLSWWDVFTFSFLYSPNNTTQLVEPSLLNGYQVGLFIQFGRFLQTPKAVKQAKQLQQVAEYDLAEYQLTLAVEVKTRYFTYVQSLASLRMFSNAAADAAGAVKSARIRFERGEAKFEEYNSTLLVFSQQSQLKIQSEAAMLVAKARLEELIGKKLEDIH